MSVIKKIIKTVGQEFVYGGHLLSLGLSGIVLTVVILAQAPIEWPLLAVCYLIAQIIYSYNHFTEAEKDRQSNPERIAYPL